MTDYRVSVGVETTVGKATADVRQVADGIDRVGTQARQAAPGIRQLERETDALSLANRRVQVEQRKVLDAERDLQRVRSSARASVQADIQASERLLQAQERLASAKQRAARIQDPSAGGGAGRGGRGVAGLVGAGVAGFTVGTVLGGFARDGIEEASQLTQATRTGVQVFGEYQQAVERFSDTAADRLGLSKSAAIDAAGGFGLLFANLELGRHEAARMSMGLVDLSVQFAAVKQTTPEQALEAMRGAFVGEYDALQRYGVNLSSAAVKQEALRQGLIATTRDALTPAQQAQVTYNLILEQGQIAAGTFAARTGDWAIKQQQTNAALNDAKAALGEGLTPFMKDASSVATGVLIPALEGVGKAIGFIGEHDTLRHLAEIVLVLEGVRRGARLVHDARVLLVGQSVKTVAANVAVARSYDAVASAATRAATAESAASTPKTRLPSVPMGPGPLLVAAGSIGTFLGGLNAVGTVKRTQSAAELDERLQELGATDQQRAGLRIERRTPGFSRWSGTSGLLSVDRHFRGVSEDRVDEAEQLVRDLEAQREKSLRASLGDPRTAMFRGLQSRESAAAALQAKIGDPGEVERIRGAVTSVFGGAFDEAADRTQGDPVAAREAKRKADRALGEAQRAYDKVRRGTPGASTAALLSAEASVRAAENAVQKRGGDPVIEQKRLEAAELRLADLRRKGGIDTDKLRAAEDRLKEARRNAGQAADEVKKAEATTALGVKDLLGRVTGQAKDARAKRDDVRKLIEAGVSAPVIEELTKLEKQAPGTFDRMAKEITPALAKSLNAQYEALGKFQKQFQDEIVLHARRSAEAAADAVVAAYAARGIAIREGNLDPNEHGAPKRPVGVVAGQVGPTVQVPAPAPAPKPVVVAPRVTHHHNTFPNARTDAEIQASLAKRERLEALR